MIYKCDFCSYKSERKKEFKKINGFLYCKECNKKKRKEHREFLKRKILKIKKRKLKEQFQPIIRNSKREKDKKRHSEKGSWYIFGYLTKIEKQFLFKKYVEQGLSNEQADKKIKRNVEYLQNFIDTQKKEKKSKEEISRRFKEEFAKLLEAGRCQKNANIVRK